MRRRSTTSKSDRLSRFCSPGSVSGWARRSCSSFSPSSKSVGTTLGQSSRGCEPPLRPSHSWNWARATQTCSTGATARALRLYGEFGWDDTCCDSVVFPLKDAVSWLAGIQLFGVLGVEGLEARFEYAESSRLSFTHAQFYRGHWTRGAVISHVMGTDGKDLYARITNRFTQDFMLGIELNRAVIGNTLNGFK